MVSLLVCTNTPFPHNVFSIVIIFVSFHFSFVIGEFVFEIDRVISLFSLFRKFLFNLFYQDRALIPEVSVAFDGVM